MKQAQYHEAMKRIQELRDILDSCGESWDLALESALDGIELAVKAQIRHTPEQAVDSHTYRT